MCFPATFSLQSTLMDNIRVQSNSAHFLFFCHVAITAMYLWLRNDANAVIALRVFFKKFSGDWAEPFTSLAIAYARKKIRPKAEDENPNTRFYILSVICLSSRLSSHFPSLVWFAMSRCSVDVRIFRFVRKMEKFGFCPTRRNLFLVTK